MTSKARLGGCIAYGGLMAVAGWWSAGSLADPSSPAAPRHATKSGARTSTSATPLDATAPLLHDRIAAHFAHWNNAADPPTVAEKLEELADFRSWQMQELGRVLVGIELARADVETAVRSLVAEIQADGPASYRAVEVLRAFIDRLTAQNPGQAWKILTSLPPNLINGDEIIGEALLVRRFKTDPESVFRYVQTSFAPYQRESLWELIARKMAVVDLPAAREALARMPGNHGRAISAVASKWAETDPEAAVRWASRFQSIPDPAVAVLHHLMRHDPLAALALEDQFSIGTLSGSLSVREQLVVSWANRDPEAALAWALGEDGGGYLREAVDGIRNPARVLELARSHASDAELRIAPELAQSFAQSDPEAALTWLRTLPEQAEADLARMRALNGMGSGGPDTQAIGRAHFAELWRPGVNVLTIGQGYHYGQAGLASGIFKLFADDPVRLWKLVDEVAARHGGLDTLVRAAAAYDYVAAAENLLLRRAEIAPSTVAGITSDLSEHDRAAASAFSTRYSEMMRRDQAE